MSKRKWNIFIEDLTSQFSSDWASRYIEALKNTERKHLKELFIQFTANRNETIEKIEKICKCLELQCHRYKSDSFFFTRLPVLANEVFSDPHALDKGTPLGRLFLHALAILQNEPFANDSLKRAEHYMYSGIIMCDISSYVTFAGLIECNSDGENENPVWKEACKRKEVLQIPLRNAMRLRNVRPFKGSRIYVVENPSVFSTILDKIEDYHELPCPPIICSSGYNSFALKELLRCISVARNYYPLEIWYSGDFDPEGLHMAQLMLNNMGEIVKLWRYSENDYQLTKESMKKVKLEKRQKLFDSLIDPDLCKIGKAIEKTHNIGYQEAIVDVLVSDIIDYLRTL